MAKRLFTSAIFTVLALCIAHTTAMANIVLDLDLKEGDQGVREAQVKPGDTQQIEVIAQQGAQGVEGVEFVLRFDPQKVTFKSFQKDGIMAAAIQLPIAPMADGVKISLGFLGQTSAADAGRLGILSVELSQDLGQGAKIGLVKGSYGAKGQVNAFDLSGGVKLINSSAAKQQPMQPGQQQPGQPGQPEQPGFHPPGQTPHQPEQPGFHPSGQPGQPQHQPGQPGPRGPQPQHQPGQPGFYPPGQPPGQGPQPHQPGQPGFYPPGQPGPQPGQPDPHMPHGPDPEYLIQQLPSGLQGVFKETLKFTDKAHLAAELKAQERILKTLEATKSFAKSAKPEEQKAIAEVLHFFHAPMPPDPHMPPEQTGGPPGMGGAPMGGQPHQMSIDLDLNQMIDQMMDDTRQHIEHIKQELSSM